MCERKRNLWKPDFSEHVKRNAGNRLTSTSILKLATRLWNCPPPPPLVYVQMDNTHYLPFNFLFFRKGGGGSTCKAQGANLQLRCGPQTKRLNLTSWPNRTTWRPVSPSHGMNHSLTIVCDDFPSTASPSSNTLRAVFASRKFQPAHPSQHMFTRPQPLSHVTSLNKVQYPQLDLQITSHADDCWYIGLRVDATSEGHTHWVSEWQSIAR